jgi:hypothetical protein
MKTLDQYFNKAARQEEIVSVAEIDEILTLKEQPKQRHPHNFFHTAFQRKEFRFARLGVITMLLGGVIFFLVVQDKPHADQEVFIPQTQRRVMQLVTNISAHSRNQEIKVSQFGSTSDPEATGIPIHLRSKFELSEDKLKLVGIKFFDDYIQYEGNVKGSGYLAFRVLRTGAKAPAKFYPLELSSVPLAGVKEYEFYPWFMTDEAGYQGFRYRFRDEPALKTTSSFFLNAIDELIPIQIDRPGFEKVTFWFSQTPELMSILESAAMISRNHQTDDGPNSDKSTPTIEIEIFPTITKGQVQVIANVLKKQRLEISLLNSSGEVLQVPANNQVLEKGDHNFSMDLSTFRKGLYFVRIKSDPGLITIHRLFKE